MTTTLKLKRPRVKYTPAMRTALSNRAPKPERSASELPPAVKAPRSASKSPPPGGSTQKAPPAAKAINPEKVERAKAWCLSLPVFKAPVPLKVGICKDLLVARPEDVTHKALKGFLRRWVKSPAYLQALARGGPRYGVGGAEDGAVAKDHQRVARKQLELMGAHK